MKRKNSFYKRGEKVLSGLATHLQPECPAAAVAPLRGEAGPGCAGRCSGTARGKAGSGGQGLPPHRRGAGGILLQKRTAIPPISHACLTGKEEKEKGGKMKKERK